MNAVKPDGSIRMKVIQAGWGSSGYYSPDVLKRDGPNIFRAGLLSFWDHPTMTEAEDRPERTLRDLAAVLTSNASWDDKGPAGPGLYADARVFGPYREAVNELAPHIGVSIRASGRVSEGEAEGKSGRLIDELVDAASVDFVTRPGAGGKVLQLFESAGRSGKVFESARQSSAHTAQEANVPDPTALEEAQTQIQALTSEVDRLRSRDILRDARDMVDEALRASRLPAFAQKRVRETLIATPPIVDNALDRSTYATAIEATVAEWSTDLAEVSGQGVIRGVGVSTASEEDISTALAAEFVAAGFSESVAAQMARG